MYLLQVSTTSTACREKVRLSTVAEARAVPGSKNRDRFRVLVRVEAPVYTPQARAPMDLVLVLDMSTTMTTGLQQLKQGARFAILNLRHDDRLALVSTPSSSRSREDDDDADLSAFTHMSDHGKLCAIRAVESLEASRSRVHITRGLRTAYAALHGRRAEKQHRAAAILLLSDGKDSVILKESQQQASRCHKSLEESDSDVALRRRFPTYTFGFGTNHDPRTLYYLAREGYGTYSFAAADEGSRNVEDAMALCIGGLTSIAARDVEVTVEAAHPEVRISEIKKGLHEGGLVSDGLGRVRIKDLFGDEEKNFVVCVNVPEEEGGSDSIKTSLLTVKAEYSNPLNNIDMKKKNNNKIMVGEAKVSVNRPPATATAAQQDHDFSDPHVATEMYRFRILNRVLGIWTDIAATSHHSPYFIKAGVKCWDIQDLDMDRVLRQLTDLLGEVDPTVKPSADPDLAALRRKLYGDINKMVDGMSRGVVAPWRGCRTCCRG